MRAQGYRQRSWQGLSRRRVLREAAVASAGLGAAAMLACAGEARPGTGPVAAEPKRGGILTHKNSNETQGTGFDPHVISIYFNQPYTLFYQSLLSHKADNYEVEPELAQRWEQPSSTEFIFHLQPGVKWHNKPPANGRALTVEDVVFSFERMRSDNPRFFHRSYFELVDKIEAVDRARVRFTLKEPDAALLTKLSMEGVSILAPEVVEQAAGRFESADKVVGTGPFIMTSVQDQVGTEFVRNPDYWKPGLPYLDGFRTIHFADDLAAWSAFQAGQIDAMHVVPGTELKKYLAQQSKDFTPQWVVNYSIFMLTPNTKVKLFDDPRVTRALRLFIDHEEHIKVISEVYYGRGENGSVFPPSTRPWDLRHEEYYNLLEWRQPKDQAVREGLDLLRAAGFSRENPLRFEFSSAAYTDAWKAQMELVQAQWRKHGGGLVETTLDPLQVAEINRKRGTKAYMYLFGGEGPGPDPSMTLDLQYRSGGLRNFTQWSDPRVDVLIQRQRGIYNVEERKAVIRELILYLADNYPGTCPSLHRHHSGVRPHVRGSLPEENLYGRQYEHVWLDKA